MRILIVEDNAVLALLVQDSLLEAGHDIVGNTASQTEAVELIERHEPELVLLDLRLAEGSGSEVIGYAAQGRNIHCLLISADARAARNLAGRCLGVLHKPFDMPTLAAAIDAVETIVRGESPREPVPLGLELFVNS